ncbi:GNAT family N-acetyltransferase [Streptomyces sp. NPDC059499]|uniref:GNAT family N-acetyltransferase n=1 Tax=Streptomyces sp. NPDC059499 TaxID=3346852 RepID=UPI0036B878E2
MEHVIRAVRAEDWPLAREIRLAALQDPVASVAFAETYEHAVAMPDTFWQQRTTDAADGVQVRQFVAEAPDGRWVGTASVLVERPAQEVRFGEAAEVDQAHVVGVFVRPEARGGGVADALFGAAVDWAWSLSAPRVERVRLYVHEHNPRAAAFYRRFGFVPSGRTVPAPDDPAARELEFVIERA